MNQEKLVLSQHGINTVIGITLDNLPTVPRVYSPIMEYVLKGLNVLTLTLLELKSVPIKDDERMKKISVACATTWLTSYYDNNDVTIDDEHFKQISLGLVDYWLSAEEENKFKDECVLSYYDNCLLVSGIIMFFNTYEIPSKRKDLIDLQRNIKKIMDNDIKKMGAINIKNITTNLPSWFWVPLMMAIDICVYQYGQLNLHPELNEFFDNFNKRFQDFGEESNEQTIRRLSAHANIVISRAWAASFPTS